MEKDEMTQQEVCVTGGTGFIASHLIRALLQKGYRVRTTVRNPDDANKTAFLWDLPEAKEKLEVVKADLLDERSLDAAVRGVTGVFHTAAPVHVSPNEDPQAAFLDPCLRGTLNLLGSCVKSSSVKKVVLTSSGATVRYHYNQKENDPPLDESSWTDPQYCREFKLWYPFAKTVGEKEAWKFSSEHEINLVSVLPSFVIGPILSPSPSSSVRFVLDLLKGDVQEYPNSKVGFIHIDDAVAAHLVAYENESASGRLLCSGEIFHWGEIVKMLRSKYPGYSITTKCDNKPGADTPYTLNSSKIQKLGLQSFKSVEEMFDDCINSFRERGLIT